MGTPNPKNWNRSAAEKCVGDILTELGSTVSPEKRERMVLLVMRAIDVSNGDAGL